MIDKESLEGINMFRSMIKLNGKALDPITPEAMEKEIEGWEKRRAEEKKREEEKKARLLGLIDGQVHKISDKTPEYESSVSDFTYDWEYDVDTTYYEYISYYVTVYRGGDRTNPLICRFEHRGTAHTEETIWRTCNETFTVEDEDCWEYTREAFEAGKHI